MPIVLDVTIIGDFRFPGGTSSSIAQEIRALREADYRVGLVQVDSPVFAHDKPMNPLIRSVAAAHDTPIIDGNDRTIESALAILENPYVFTVNPLEPPKIRAENKILVAHQPIRDANDIPYYDPDQVHDICESLVGEGVVWAPISPVSRRGFQNSGFTHDILDEDWTNFIFPKEWSVRRTKPASDKAVIGRHSRGEWEKWPASRADILTVYPDDERLSVRFLGAGDELLRIMGGQYPGNWETLPFGASEPREFLRTIDFFVYFHHPDWIEAFGRTVLEACASGAIAILPEYLKPTFGDAALYCAPADVVPTVDRLYSDWNAYRKISRKSRRIVAQKYGPETYIKRIERLIGKPRKLGLPYQIESIERDVFDAPAETETPTEFHVVIAGDLCLPSDAAFRIAHEVQIQAAAGYSTGLVHIASGKTDAFHMHPEIRSTLTAGLASLVRGDMADVKSRIVVIHSPKVIESKIFQNIPRIFADQIVIVLDHKPANDNEIQRTHWMFERLFEASAIWAPINDEVRAALMEAAPDIPLYVDDWRPAISMRHWNERSLKSSTPVIGSLGGNDRRQWPRETDFKRLYPDADDVVVRFLGIPKLAGMPIQDVPMRWECFDLHTISPGKFLDSLDFLFCFPMGRSGLFETAVADAMVRGVVPVMSRNYAADFSGGVICPSYYDAVSQIREIHGDPERYRTLSRKAARTGRRLFPERNHLTRLLRLIGPPKTPSAISITQRKKRALFLSSNGVGLGHLARLIALARRMPDDIEPVFATMSQAVTVPNAFGYQVEYIPFHEYLACDVVDWNGWLRQQLEQIIVYYGATAVVFDGSNPYSGLIEAVAPRSDIHFVWIRRGMWRAQQANQPLIQRQRFFDVIIEPGDIAEARDKGLTTEHRGRALKIEPIRLLEPEELLDRACAAAHIGLDPNRPAALIQLGAGSNRDIVTLTDQAVKACGNWPELQLVLAEWMMSPIPHDLWPGIRRVRGFPLSRYFNAFDFTITAAGYNSFNEILSFGLPAIFFANENPVMDDQGARAAFAQENGAGFMLDERDTDGLELAVAALMEPSIRALVRANGMRIARPNGAQDAVAVISNLINGYDIHDQQGYEIHEQQRVEVDERSGTESVRGDSQVIAQGGEPAPAGRLPRESSP